MSVRNSIFSKIGVLGRRLAYLLTRRDISSLGDYMKREMYGMDIREQAAVKQVLSMAGRVITVRRDTVAINRKLKLCLLQEGDQIRISKNPILFDEERNIYVALLDSNYNDLALKLADYLTDIYAADAE